MDEFFHVFNFNFADFVSPQLIWLTNTYKGNRTYLLVDVMLCLFFFGFAGMEIVVQS